MSMRIKNTGKDHSITIRLNDLQYDYILKYSKVLNISVSQFIRMILDNLVINEDIEKTFDIRK